MPEPMRRDVRLLGDILGEVIRDSDPNTGPELLAEVERLRHAVIAARQRQSDAKTGDEIAELVASWSL
jgi:phosphoenolpyruvate carboxylase